jgi:hypothetical protein
LVISVSACTEHLLETGIQGVTSGLRAGHTGEYAQTGGDFQPFTTARIFVTISGRSTDKNGGMVQLRKRRRAEEASSSTATTPVVESRTRLIEAISIPMGDPLETLLLSSGGPVVLQDLVLESATIDAARSAGVDLVVPLIGKGELLGARPLFGPPSLRPTLFDR